MSVINPLPAPVVQMGHVEKIVEAVQNHPEVQQLVAQDVAVRALKEDNSRVADVDAPKQGQKVRDREAEKKEQRRAGGQKKEQPEPEGDGEQEAAPAASNPWAGKIVNLKV